MIANENYRKYVIDDLRNHKGLYHPVKAPLFMRIKTINMNPKKLHPNPEDEFSVEEIGPNWEIVNDYEKSIRLNLEVDLQMFPEPLMVTKLDKGGYMLLNGHHRWLAALNVQVPRFFKGLGYKIPNVPVKIVNVTGEEDIYKVVNKSSRDKCVTIDLDEVLLIDDSPKAPFNRIYKINLRENASLLICELKRMGFDVWVYTGSYMSAAYINGLFKVNNCKVDGVVNGINGKTKVVNLRDIFRNKYKHIVHVDNSTITCVDTKLKDYEIVDITSDESGWAAAVVEMVKQLNI